MDRPRMTIGALAVAACVVGCGRPRLGPRCNSPRDRRLGTCLASMKQKAATRHHPRLTEINSSLPRNPEMSQPHSRLQTPRQAVPPKMPATLLSNPLNH
jgi:hypothetical protein